MTIFRQVTELHSEKYLLFPLTFDDVIKSHDRFLDAL